MTQQGSEQTKILQFPQVRSTAIDELNLCEFPLTFLGDRAPKGELILEFKDTIYDEQLGANVQRSVTISTPPNCGLPTAKDEEVLLALLHLTWMKNRFREPTVNFTRFEVIKLLCWPNSGQSYRRLDESLNRWMGIKLDYKHAFRDRKEKRWRTESFHILEHVELCERNDYDEDDQTNLPLSSFTWNRIIFRSMTNRNTKPLSLDFFLSLRTATAKRMYRFLDKRFGLKPRWEFDLQDFAFEHIGVSRNYPIAKIKEKLEPAIVELVERGFIADCGKMDRYFKHPLQGWRVVFAKQERPFDLVLEQTVVNIPIAKELIDRGVTESVAQQLASTCDHNEIEKQIDVFDWLLDQKNTKALRNPGGYLAEAIRDKYAPPTNYQPREERERIKAQIASKKIASMNKKSKEELDLKRQRDERAHIQNLLTTLSADEIARILAGAIDSASENDRVMAQKNDVFGEMIRQSLLEGELLRRYPTPATK